MRVYESGDLRGRWSPFFFKKYNWENILAKLNKSDAIRDYAKANPDAGLTEISRALAAKGIEVSPAHVAQALRSVGLYKSKGKRKGAKASTSAKQKESPKVSKVNDNVIEVVNAAKAFIKACGSVEDAIQLLKAVS